MEVVPPFTGPATKTVGITCHGASAGPAGMLIAATRTTTRAASQFSRQHVDCPDAVTRSLFHHCGCPYATNLLRSGRRREVEQKSKNPRSRYPA